jgi:hypothetical protein
VVGPNKHFLFQLAEIEVPGVDAACFIYLWLICFVWIFDNYITTHIFPVLPRIGVIRLISQGLDALWL